MVTTRVRGRRSFVLDDRTRRFEPDYAAGAYYPDIVPMRRLRFTVQNGVGSGTTYDQGIWYVSSWNPDWPDRLINQETTAECTDGFTVMATDDIPLLDPPDAGSYADVVGFDEPWGYWRLGDPPGTKARPNIIKWKKHAGKHDHKPTRKFKRRRGTRFLPPEVGAVAGPAGTYRNKPALQQPGLVVGDSDASVLFTAANSQWVRVVFEDGDLNADEITLEAIVKPMSSALTSRYIIAGPETGGGPPAFFLQHVSSEVFGFGIIDSLGNSHLITGVTSIVPGTRYHVAGTWDGQTLNLYVDNSGDAAPVSTGGRPIGSWSTNVLGIGANTTPTQFFDGYIDEAAIYEKALTQHRIVDAHMTASGFRGYARETAGERIAETASYFLWSEDGIQTTGRDVVPVMQHGQSRIEEIAETAHSEGPRTMFYLNGLGNPIYLGHEWAAEGTRGNTVQTTIGNQTGETPYEDIELVYDDEIYNDVTTSTVDSESVNVTDTDSISAYGRRANTEWTDVLLAEQGDVESLAGAVKDFYATPAFRPVTVNLNGDDSTARAQILARTPGDLVRIKHRPKAGTAIDRVCHIIGVDYSIDRGDSSARGRLTARWNLSRGFNGEDGLWHAGVVGYSEAGVTTVAA